MSVAGPACTVCERCARRFSEDAQFCPFDGARLALDRVFPPDPLVGELVDGRYRVKHVLGEGGMGIVYEVRHEQLGRPLALKVLRHDLAQEDSLCRRFIQEARAAAVVCHPGIVQIMDFGALPTGQPYFVMELLRGHSLSRVMRAERPLSIERLVNITEQLVDALQAAHKANVVHRDLKPDNIQVIRDARGRECVKILDFGLARVGGASRLTKQGFVFGTPHYMSPEQALGDDADHRADIYALGVLMYEMCAGQLPFDADSYMGVLTHHIQTPPIRPSKLPQGRSLGALETVILRCLEKKPERRYASMERVAADLSVAVRRSRDGIELAPRRALLSNFVRPVGSAGRSRRGQLLGLAGLTAVVAGGAGWWVVSRGLSGESHQEQLPARAGSAVLDQRRFVNAASTLEPAKTGPVSSASASSSASLSPRAVEAARPPLDTPADKSDTASGVKRAGHTPAPTAGRSVTAPLPTTEIIDPWADPRPRRE